MEYKLLCIHFICLKIKEWIWVFITLPLQRLFAFLIFNPLSTSKQAEFDVIYFSKKANLYTRVNSKVIELDHFVFHIEIKGLCSRKRLVGEPVRETFLELEWPSCFKNHIAFEACFKIKCTLVILVVPW